MTPGAQGGALLPQLRTSPVIVGYTILAVLESSQSLRFQTNHDCWTSPSPHSLEDHSMSNA